MPNKKKKKNAKGNYLPQAELESAVLKLLHKHPKKGFEASQIAKHLKIDNARDSIQHALNKLHRQEQVFELGNSRYRLSREAAALVPSAPMRGSYEGTVEVTRTGAAFVTCEGLSRDVFVHPRNLGNALHGDRVRLTVQLRKQGAPEGAVVEVLERNTHEFIGTLYVGKTSALVVPDHPKVNIDILVELHQLNGGRDGDKVLVQVTQWHGTPGSRQHPLGKIAVVLGKSGTSDIEMKSILLSAGFPLQFPSDVLRQAEGIGQAISEAEIARRRDMRAVTTFTIDPSDARDFDDALSIAELPNGLVQVGVHIADVSHYVQPNTPLDLEAYRRSTSVYLVDRVLPMLPEQLSNQLCSLRPHEDKLTFSVVFDLQPADGSIVAQWMGRTVIHSDRRFSYEQAQQVLETGTGDFAAELATLHRIATQLRQARLRAGALNFEQPEVRFRLDPETGKPLGVYLKERKDAHLLIEDFMLLANRQVAALFALRPQQQLPPLPMVYRVHDQPDMEKVAELLRFAHSLGYRVQAQHTGQVAQAYNELIAAAAGKPELDVFQDLAIRTMAKAVYSPHNIGHYGLAFPHYSHFTSPIRRYADLLAHRILADYLGDTPYSTSVAALEEQCEHISRQERKAAEAERESVKYKQVEYLQDHIGQEFDGAVTGVSERGFFVELLDNYCEGMVRFDSLREPYIADPATYTVRGLRSGQVLRIGTPVRVRVLAAHAAKRQIDLTLVEP